MASAREAAGNAANRAGDGVKKAASGISDTIYTIIVVVVVVVIAVVIWRVWKGTQAVGRAVGDGLSDIAIANATGIPKQRVNFLRSMAQQMVDSIIKRFSVFGWFHLADDIDEDLYISKLNTLVSPAEVKLLCQFYQDQRPNGLKKDVDDSFDDSEKRKLKTGIYSNLS